MGSKIASEIAKNMLKKSFQDTFFSLKTEEKSKIDQNAKRKTY